MADLRIPSANIPPARPQPAARVEGASAAQRAFFQAALNTAVAAQPASSPAAATPKADPAAPQRLPRPGSLLDIKV